MTPRIIRFAALATLLLFAACTTTSSPGAAFGSSDPYPWQNRAFRGQPNP